MADPFLTAAGPAPARGAEGRWRQVALLAASAAIEGSPRAGSGLAAVLLALDHPEAAAAVAARVPDDPWSRWWTTLAAGQTEGAGGLGSAIAAARAGADPGPDGREVARRLADLEAEVTALGGRPADDARFGVLGHRARPERRVLLVGRSSAAYLVEPAWDGARLVRLAPSDGPAGGNRAHLTLPEVIAGMRRGDAGAGREVPGDAPAALEPEAMLNALREDPQVRDRRLIALAQEVRDERARLVDERHELEQERAMLRAEAARRRRPRPAPAPTPRIAAVPGTVPLPRTATEAAEILGVAADASGAEIDRAYRDLVTRCHPDRVAGLHPVIRGQAEGLTVAVNAARDLMLGRVPRRPARRSAAG